MRGRRLLSYRDAVAILGGDSEALSAADQVLGGALSAATGGASDAVLGLFGAQGRVLRIGRDLTAGLRDRLGSSERADRTEKIAAAHAVLVITAFFEAMEELELPFAFDALELSGREQITLAGGDTDAGALAQVLLTAEVPQPNSFEPFEVTLEALRRWYGQLMFRLLTFVYGLAVWERLNEAQRRQASDVLSTVDERAVARYQELFSQLALDIPEFGFWTSQVEHQATRNELRQSLDGVAHALSGLTLPAGLGHAADGLTTAYRAALGRAILSEGEAPSGITVPTLAAGYVDPDFRVGPVLEDGSGPAREDWWERMPVRSDLAEFLAGTLTSLAPATAPLLVLGQPGAGKSVLTKILAARLSGTGYLPVRVILREIRAEDDIQDQIEHAVRSTTGERTSWPDLVRSAPGAVPVLLFDGFDELLQATGVNQTDYLVRIAKFQQREADQGRPVYAMVTSRTAVADRARCPQGTIALRLEPFRTPHIRRWLTVWNGINAPHFTAQGLRPLPTEVAARHPELASQPLLLLMLALYDATANALQQEAVGGEPLAAADLYEELLTNFAVREIGKSGDALTPRRRAEHCERELQRLSLIAFGILNRRRQWITTAELDQDLTALLGRPAATERDGFRTPLGQGEIALGRFFFVQRAQALQDERELTTYEFLHATFGEYLVARLSVQLLEQLLDQRPALALGRVGVDDDLLYALLSYALLASRQMLRFVQARVDRIGPEGRERLAELLITVMEDARGRVEHKYADYRPIPRATAARHGKYEANLIMLTICLTGGITASELFPEAADPAGIWPHRIQLWRSALTEQEWTDFALAIEVRRGWAGDRRELTVLPGSGATEEPEDVDPYWVYRYAPGQGPRAIESTWSRSSWQEIRHKMDVGEGGHDSVLRHALDPLFARFGPALTTFHGESERHTSSWAHDLLELWLASHLDRLEELTVRYERCAQLLRRAVDSPPELQDPLASLVLGQLLADAHRLPCEVVHEVLAAVGFMGRSMTDVVLEVRIALRRLETLDPDVPDGAEREPVWAELTSLLHRLLGVLVQNRPELLPGVWDVATHTRPAWNLLAQYEDRVPEETAVRLREIRRRYDGH
ncbi:NACHT domain-containing protein [Streptomyces sp. NPDC054863]